MMTVLRVLCTFLLLSLLLTCGDGISIGPDYSDWGNGNINPQFFIITEPGPGDTLSGHNEVKVLLDRDDFDRGEVKLHLDWPDAEFQIMSIEDSSASGIRFRHLWSTGDETVQGNRSIIAMAMSTRGDSLYSQVVPVFLSN
jgi:hypothetical protein